MREIPARSARSAGFSSGSRTPRELCSSQGREANLATGLATRQQVVKASPQAGL
jgi:hypothetical protein